MTPWIDGVEAATIFMPGAFVPANRTAIKIFNNDPIYLEWKSHTKTTNLRHKCTYIWIFPLIPMPNPTTLVFTTSVLSTPSPLTLIHFSPTFLHLPFSPFLLTHFHLALFIESILPAIRHPNQDVLRHIHPWWFQRMVT